MDGNLFLSAVFLVFMGALRKEYRATLLENGKMYLDEFGVGYSSDYKLFKILSRPTEISKWTYAGI